MLMVCYSSSNFVTLFFLWFYMMKVMAIISFSLEKNTGFCGSLFCWVFLNQEKQRSKESNTWFFFPSWKCKIVAFRNSEISSKSNFLNGKYLVLKHCVVYSKGVKSSLLYVKPFFITFMIGLKSAVSNSNLIKFYLSTVLSQCLWINIFIYTLILLLFQFCFHVSY